MLFAFDFLCIFFFLSISCMGIKERRRNTQLCKLKHHHFAMLKHTYVVHDWQVLVVRWLFIPSSQNFLVLPIKKSDMSIKYKRLLNRTHHQHEPQNSLAQLCIKMLIQGTQVSIYTNTHCFCIFLIFQFFFIFI